MRNYDLLLLMNDLIEKEDWILYRRSQSLKRKPLMPSRPLLISLTLGSVQEQERIREHTRIQ